MAFTNQSGSEGLIVDIQAGLTRPLSDLLPPEDGGSSLAEVRISSNEQFLFAEGGGQIRLLSLGGGLAEAGAGKTFPGDVAYFNADGTALFTAESVPKPAPEEGSWDRVRRIPLDGSAEEVLAERADVLLGVAGDAALTREGDVHTLTGHPGDGRKVDFGLTEGELAFIGQPPIDGTGLTAINNEETDQRRYAFLDTKSLSVKQVDALNGFKGAAEPRGRFLLFSNIRLPDTSGSDQSEDSDSDETTAKPKEVGKGDYAIIDLVTGEVRTSPFDLGAHQQNVQPSLSPDGTQVAVARSNDDGDPLTSIVSLGGPKPTNLDTGFAGWSPSGSAFIGRRLDKSKEAMHVFVAENGREREIALGKIVAVVWTAR